VKLSSSNTQQKNELSYARELAIFFMVYLPSPSRATRVNPGKVLTSSMKLEYSLNDAVPNTAHSRDRLLAKIFQYRKDAACAEEGTVVAKDEDYEVLYTYILVTGLLAEEIKKVQNEVEDLFGVMDEEALELK
jgi:hypothetical protein